VARLAFGSRILCRMLGAVPMLRDLERLFLYEIAER
jgi:hypothetical protein